MVVEYIGLANGILNSIADSEWAKKVYDIIQKNRDRRVALAHSIAVGYKRAKEKGYDDVLGMVEEISGYFLETLNKYNMLEEGRDPRGYSISREDAGISYRDLLLAAAPYILEARGGEAYETGETETGTNQQEPEPTPQESDDQGTEQRIVRAVLVFLSLASLAYFALVPQKTTINVIVPMTTNVPGLLLSFILLCFGAWLVFKK